MATVQFEYDPERLIDEVKKRPGIWDFENAEYRTKNMRHKLWTEVVSELITNEVKITKSERRELEIQLQKKWKGIRDCFQKYVSHPNRSKRPYLYSRQLQFLIKNDSQNTEVGSSESDDGRSKTVWKPKKKLKLNKDSYVDSFKEDNEDDNDDYKSNDDLSIEVPVKQNGYKQVIDEFAFASVDSQSRTETEDPDKLFLLSLLPHIKSVPEEMRLNVKMDMMQFEYDPERLIEEVKKRPGIWDFDNVDYRTRNTRHKLWTEVVNELMTNDVKISKSERRELELQLQKKWKSIRDCFQKYITHPNRTKRPYIYSRELQFLIKTENIQNIETGSSESDDFNTKRTSWKPRKKLKLTKDSSDEDNNIDNEDCISSADDVSIEERVKQRNNFKPVISEFAFASVDSQSRYEPEDPDKLFLLSLLPHIKSIPEDMRLNIKMEIMQVLRNANYQSPVGRKII